MSHTGVTTVKIAPRQSLAVSVNPKKTILLNQAGIGGAKRIGDLIDVDVSAKVDGSFIVYDEAQEKFIASRSLNLVSANVVGNLGVGGIVEANLFVGTIDGGIY
jgi:hypothetical protein